MMSYEVVWNTEFPAEFLPPQELLAMVRSGEVEDFSWHNDATPSFGWTQPNGGLRVVIWSSPAAPELRECPEFARFAVVVSHDNETGPRFMLVTDDVNEAIRVYREQARWARQKSGVLS